jgi:hypothetical protein
MRLGVHDAETVDYYGKSHTGVMAPTELLPLLRVHHANS